MGRGEAAAIGTLCHFGRWSATANDLDNDMPLVAPPVRDSARWSATKNQSRLMSEFGQFGVPEARHSMAGGAHAEHG
jgi:hypothetical protein